MSRFLRNTPFKQQLNIVVSVMVLLFSTTASLLTSWQGSQQIRDTFIKQGERITENLASQSVLALLYASADNVQTALNITLAFPDIQWVEILYADGERLVAIGKKDGSADIAATLQLDAMLHTARLESETAEEWRFIAPVWAKQEATPLDATSDKDKLLGYVRVVQSKATLSRAQLLVFAINLAISLLFALVLLLVLRYLATRLTQPLLSLAVSMARAAKGDLTVRARLNGPQDIADMAGAFNSMIGSLQDRERLAQQVRAVEAAHAETRIIAEREHAERERQRRFLAMLTHELKTPLSVIRMCLCTPQPSPRMQAHADTAISDIDAIIERVALTTRIEDQSVPLQHQDCRVDEVLAELCTQQAQAARVVLELPAEIGAERLTTDPLLLRTALGNLLDNALKYAPADAMAHIDVAAQSLAGQAGLRIRVTNPAGPAGRPDPAQVFQKYYRAPAAHRQSGSGLGLYIVQELVELLGGRIRYLADNPDDICFELWLPHHPTQRPPE